MTKTLRAALALSLISLVAAGCGAASGSGSDTATLAPPSSFLYFEATIDPSGDQESAMRSIIDDFPGDGPPENRIHALLQKASQSAKEANVDYEKDIRPWLGDKVGAFITGSGRRPAGAVVFATTDEDAAREAIEQSAGEGAQQKSYKDVDYTFKDDLAGGVVDGFAVLGSEGGIRAAIDASKAESLSESERYKKAIDGADDDRVALLFQDPSGLFNFASGAAGGQLGPAGPLLGRMFGSKPVVATVRAEQHALVMDGSVAPAGGLAGMFGESTDVIGDVPADSWLSAGTRDFGAQLEQLMALFGGLAGGTQGLKDMLREQTGIDLDRDVFSWLGDTAFFVHGDSKETIGGGVLIESKDADASERALTRLAAAIQQNDPDTRVAAARIPGATGYTLQDPSMPKPVYFVQAGERVALAYGEEAARSALSDGDKLEDAAHYTRATGALGGGFAPAMYLSLPPIVDLAESFGAAEYPEFAEVRRYLTALDYVVAGSAESGDKVTSRMRIGFKPHE